MVAGSIEERIKKMKNAILMEAKERAHNAVEHASEEADQERAKIYHREKDRIVAEFALMAKAEKVKDKMSPLCHLARRAHSTTDTAFAGCRPDTNSSRSLGEKSRKDSGKWSATPLSTPHSPANSSYRY
jgi:hypothetical protein